MDIVNDEKLKVFKIFHFFCLNREMNYIMNYMMKIGNDYEKIYFFYISANGAYKINRNKS